MSDSCGIFFVGLPGVYTQNKNIYDLHDKHIRGVLFRAHTVAPVTVEDDGDSADAELCDDSYEGEALIRKENGGFDRIDDNAGPGQSLTTYLPKEDSLMAKMRPADRFGGIGRSCGLTRERP